MSRTITTNSGTDFFTNINAEQMLGELCKEVGAKYFSHPKYCEMPKLAYSMTNEEAKYASNKLKELANDDERINKIFPYYKHFLEQNASIENFKQTIFEYADDFEKSEGYICEG